MDTERIDKIFEGRHENLDEVIVGYNGMTSKMTIIFAREDIKTGERFKSAVKNVSITDNEALDRSVGYVEKLAKGESLKFTVAQPRAQNSMHYTDEMNDRVCKQFFEKVENFFKGLTPNKVLLVEF